MHQYDDPTGVASRPAPLAAGTPVWFNRGNATAGIKGSKVPADWLNDIMGNFLALMSAAGVTLVKGAGGDQNLLAAIRKVAASGRGATILRSAAQSIPNNVETVITWQSEYRDTDGIWTSGAPTVLTVPAGVSYVRLSCQVIFEAAAAGYRKVRILKSGTVPTGMPSTTSPSTGSVDATVLSCVGAIVPVAPGDAFDVRVLQTSGAALNIRAAESWAAMEIIA